VDKKGEKVNAKGLVKNEGVTPTLNSLISFLLLLHLLLLLLLIQRMTFNNRH
jgi:hypothetical protein